ERFAPHYFDHSQDLICNLCSYERSPYVPGDVNGVEGVDMDDAIYTLFHCSFPEDYPVNQDPDFDSNGEIDMDDAIYLLFYCSFPEDYPLIPWLWPLPAETSGSVSFPSGKPTDGIRIDVGGWEYNGIIPALAAADGIVTEAKYFPDRGNHVTVDHGNGYLTYYSHLNSISVSVGDKVSQGDTLGMLGATGMTSPDNVNLYFVLLMPDGKGGESIRVNPLNYVFLPPSIQV
ncbi:MAG: M23 family metallopeptidase, partial [Clostridia bacterium]|nr:M23 family metallopeptidase [Clostridia bacterium]